MAYFTKQICSLFMVVALAACTTESDAFFVSGATMAEPEIHSVAQSEPLQNWRSNIGMKIGVSGHRIVPGEGTVIAFRSQRSNLLVMDSASFEKLTIFIDKPLPGKTGVIRLGENGRAFAFWSVGDAISAPDADCVGWASEGLVEYQRASANEVAFDIRMRIRTVELSSIHIHHIPCRAFSFERETTLSEKNVLTLTPWEGRPSEDIIDEVFR